MRLAFFGNNRLGWQILRWLKEYGEEIVALVLHPPERRKYEAEILQTASLPADRVFDASRLDQQEVLQALGRLKPDLGIVVCLGYILRRPLLNLIPGGCINVHTSLLPYNRGSYPNVWSIVDGTPAGVTIHHVDEQVDTGDILAQQPVAAEPTDTGATLYGKLETAAFNLFQQTWPLIRAGTMPRHPQTNVAATSHRCRDVEHIDHIDLDQTYTARALIDVLRARTFPPHRGAYFIANDRKVYLRLHLEYESASSEEATRPSWMTINGREIGAGHPVYVIAELSANHHQDFDQAVRLVRAVKEAGADAVKLQTYTPDTLTLRSDRPEFRVGGGTLWDGRTLYDLYAEAYTPWDWQSKLKEIANEMGLDFFSTAFDPSSVEFLQELGVPVHKVASFELVDIPLIEKMARTGKPLILSTGLATEEEIAEAVAAARKAGASEIALLKCTSAYPAPPEEMNLRSIPYLVEKFGVPVGLSDHTLGIAVPVAAVALGACIVEKHFTLSRNIPGPDSAFSLEPDEFRAMVEAIRTAEKALGQPRYGGNPRENASRVFRRSLFVVKDVKTGDAFTPENVRSIRPGHGLAPKYLSSVIGKRATLNVAAGTPLSLKMVG